MPLALKSLRDRGGSFMIHRIFCLMAHSDSRREALRAKGAGIVKSVAEDYAASDPLVGKV